MDKLFSILGAEILFLLVSSNITGHEVSNSASMIFGVLSAVLLCLSAVIKYKEANRSISSLNKLP